jgi:hypothetical protein
MPPTLRTRRPRKGIAYSKRHPSGVSGPMNSSGVAEGTQEDRLYRTKRNVRRRRVQAITRNNLRKPKFGYPFKTDAA